VRDTIALFCGGIQLELIPAAPCLAFAIFILAIAEVSMEHALLWAIQRTGELKYLLI
jgi:hypothetical protein